MINKPEGSPASTRPTIVDIDLIYLNDRTPGYVIEWFNLIQSVNGNRNARSLDGPTRVLLLVHPPWSRTCGVTKTSPLEKVAEISDVKPRLCSRRLLIGELSIDAIMAAA